MAYKQFVPLVNMNFQFNRVFTYGDAACREEELWEAAAKVKEFDFDTWHAEWNRLGRRAESEGRLMHAAYYHRLAEFFLPDHRPEKEETYKSFRSCFYRAVEGEDFERFEVPYGENSLPVMRLKAAEEKGIILLHGGYDSFMEEFYLESKKLPPQGYTVIIFEGPGQGRTLRDGLKMTSEWEKPVAAILDYFHLEGVTLVGISLGGYLALRAAAYEPRIARVVAYDVVWDALGCFTRHFPDEFRQMVLDGRKDEVNAAIEAARQTSDLVEWAVSHGMYINGSETPFDYLNTMSRFNTRELSPLIKQDVLVLAGENDHFIPVEYYDLQIKALTNARSVKGRMFTAAEGGDQHCQVGNLDLAWEEIIGWLDSF